MPAPADVPPRAEHHISLVLTTRADATMRFAIEAPGGSGRTAFVGIGETAVLDTPAGRIAIDGTLPARASGDRPIYVILSGGGELATELRGGTWLLHARGPGRFDAWIAGEELGDTLSPVRFDGPFAVIDESITIPATAPDLIAVGALVSRVHFEMRAVEPG